MPTPNLRALGALALLACCTAAAAAERELALPSAQEYFSWAAAVQACDALGADAAGLAALRKQAIDYYRTTLARSAKRDPAQVQALRELEADKIPPDALADAMAQKAQVPAASLPARCRLLGLAIDQALARDEFAMASTGVPHAKPLEQARDEAAALGVTGIDRSYARALARPDDALPAEPAGTLVPAVDTSKPHLLKTAKCVRPEYPPAAARAGAMGTTRLRFTIDAHGQVIDAEVVEASGPTREHRILDNAAKEAFSHCEFAAGVDADGQPVQGSFLVSYVWHLS